MITIYLALVLFGHNACQARVECTEGDAVCSVRMSKCTLTDEQAAQASVLTAYGRQAMTCELKGKRLACATERPQ